MRNLLFAAWVAGLVAPAGASDPIVVRPAGSAVPTAAPSIQRPVVTYSDPNRPGFLIVRPQMTAGTPGGAVLEPVRRQPASTPVPAAPSTGPLKPAPIPAAGDNPALPAPTPAAPDGKLVLDTWDAVFLKDQHVGYFHVTIREFTRDGQKFLYGVKEQKMTVARFGQVVEQFAEDATTELADGTVLTTLTVQGIGRDQKLSLAGKVDGPVLRVSVTGAGGGVKVVPWPEGVVGVAKEATLMMDRKPKPGDTFEYRAYLGQIAQSVRHVATVGQPRNLSMSAGQPPRAVLPVTVAMDPIKDATTGTEFKLPPATAFFDAATYEQLRIDAEIPQLGGVVVALRATREQATRPVGKVPDLFEVQSIPLDKPIPNVHAQGAVVYRVGTNPAVVRADKVFGADGRQTLVASDPAGRSADYRVTATVPAEATPVQPPDGCLSSNFFIDWDVDVVKQRAQAAAAGLPATATALDKARAVEAWVHRNMRSTEFSQAMATCSNVAGSLSGDCTEYAMLAAGLCRALGVPSRTAIGVVYAPDKNGKPYLAYHMWFEAWVGDRWVSLDATLGRGGVGPGHLRITAVDWHEERSFAPLLPVLTILGAGPRVEVIRVEGK